MSALHVGVTPPPHQARDREQVLDISRVAQHAERVGLDGVWAGDHLTTGSSIRDSTVALTMAAAVTESVHIGYAVMLPGATQPAWAAKQIASLQYLSGNPLPLEVGVGGVGTLGEWHARRRA